MKTYDSTNEYDVLLRIFRFVRDYSTSTFSLERVCNDLVKSLRQDGHTVTQLDSNRYGYRIIQVDDHRFRIINWPDWTRYDVQLVA